MIASRTTWSILMVVLSAGSVMGQVVYDDGQEHVLTDDILGRQVIVSNRSRLDVQARIDSFESPALTVNDATVNVNGGFIGGEGEVVLATGESSVTLNGGGVGVNSDRGTAIIASDSTSVVVRGGSIGGATGGMTLGGPTVQLRDSATLLLADGNVDGLNSSGSSSTLMTGGRIGWWHSGVQLTGASIFEMSGGTVSAVAGRAFSLSANSRLTMTGGTIRFSVADECANSLGIAAGGNATVTIQDAEMTSEGAGCGGCRYVSAAGDATLDIMRSEGVIRGAIDEELFTTNGNTTMVMRESDFGADMHENWLNPGELSFFAAHGGSQITLDDGTYGATLWYSPPAVSVFSASEQAELHIERGRFQVETEVQPTSSIARGVYGTGQSRTEVRGGSFEFGAAFADVRHLEARDGATITLYGSDFNYPPSEPIQPLEGTITGTLSDGNSIEWIFQRDATATIMLVPEPSSLVLLVLSALGMIATQRR